MTTYKKTNIQNEPSGPFRYHCVFAPDRVTLVRIRGFLNRNGFQECYLPAKSKQTPWGSWMAVWRISARTTLAGKIFKEIYTFAKGRIAGTIAPCKYSSVQQKTFRDRLEALEAKKQFPSS
jgi:hypothetical protein